MDPAPRSTQAVVFDFGGVSRKPERAIFEITASRLGMQPGKILLFDDIDQRELGWETMHVTDPVVAAAELAARLGS